MNRTHFPGVFASFAAGIAIALTAAPALVRAQATDAYPSRPIQMIVAYAPGGGTDLIARMFARVLAKNLGPNASIVVQNKTGAGGAIGFTELARAAPDGYTIGFINTPNVLTIPIERKVAFTWQSYDLLGNLVDDPGSFAMRKDHPVNTLTDLTAFAKANPGAVAVGTTGTGSDDHLAMLLFEKATGTKMTHVPYKGSGEVRGAIVGGEITVAAINVGEALAYVSAGTPIKVLGQMSAARTRLAPNVPTFKDQGVDIELAALRGMAAPKGLPEAIRRKLVEAVAKSVADPQFQKEAEGIFSPIRFLAPAEYARELEAAERGFRQLWTQVPWGDGKN